MAAFVFTIGGKKSEEKINQIRNLIACGAYSTRVNITKSGLPEEGTLADYLSMQDGDDVYFFAGRKFYGVGRLKKVGADCKYNNFPGASKLRQGNAKAALLTGQTQKETLQMRWVCFFKKAPAFYREGLDMDEVLSYKPQCFKMIRALWKRSFIKLDDEEARALREIFIIRHLESGSKLFESGLSAHEKAKKKNLSNYVMRADDVWGRAYLQNKRIAHEMAIEACVVSRLMSGKSILGKWDYVSHQVIASPFKPVDYMDKMDVFAMKYNSKSDRIPCKYLVAEIKKETVTKEVVKQLMRYVDWVSANYAYGNYGLIEAYIIAPKFADDVETEIKKNAIRNYQMGSRSETPEPWQKIRLVRCSIESGELVLGFR